MSATNLYEVLGIPLTASADEVKKGYFALAKKYHPDSGSDEEIKKFYEISEAYEVLSDAEKRKAYDLTISDRILSGDLLRPMFAADRVTAAVHMPNKTDEQREKFRQRQQFHFRRELFITACVRVALGGIVLGFIGFYLNTLFWRPWGTIGGFLAFVSGLFLALYRNFDMDSFGFLPSRLKLLRLIRLLLFTVTIGYFILVASFYFLRV